MAVQTAVAQQVYDYTQRQAYDKEPKPQTFVYDCLRFRALTDSTAEMYGIECYLEPGSCSVEIPSIAIDSVGHEYTVVGIADYACNHSGDTFHFGHPQVAMDTLVLPSTMVEIGQDAFFHTLSLSYVNFPPSLRRVGSGAFWQSRIGGTLELPDGLAIEDSAFLETFVDSFAVYPTGGQPEICVIDGIVYSADTTRLIVAPARAYDTLAVPPTVRRIEHLALRNCTAQAVLLPEGLREIGCHAFPATLQALHIPSTVSRIEGPLIIGMVPSSFTLTVAGGNTHYRFADNMLRSYDGDTLVMVVGDWSGSKPLPVEITVIGQYAFYGQRYLSGVGLSEGLVEIGPYAFALSGCREFVLPSTLKRIGAFAFYSIQSGPLGNNGILALPDGMTDMGSYAFCASRCNRLKLPDSLTYIPEGAFHMFGANMVFFGHHIEHVYPRAFCGSFFEYGDSLAWVDHTMRFMNALPATLRTVGHHAFYCHSFPTSPLRFEGSPDSVGAFAFNSCATVTFGDTVPPVVFVGAFAGADTVNVPCGGAAAFAAAPGWGTGFTYVEGPCPPPAGIGEAENTGLRVEVTPNPAGGMARVTASATVETAELLDATGTPLRTYGVHATAFTADLSGIPSGTYLLRIHTPLGTATKKLVVR